MHFELELSTIIKIAILKLAANRGESKGKKGIIISNHNEPYLPVVQKHFHGEQTVWSWYENFLTFEILIKSRFRYPRIKPKFVVKIVHIIAHTFCYKLL